MCSYFDQKKIIKQDSAHSNFIFVLKNFKELNVYTWLNFICLTEFKVKFAELIRGCKKKKKRIFVYSEEHKLYRSNTIASTYYKRNKAFANTDIVTEPLQIIHAPGF